MVREFGNATVSDELYEKIVGHSVIDGDGYIGEGKFSKVHYKDIGGNFHSRDGKLILKEIYYDNENDTLYLSRMNKYGDKIQEYIIKDSGKWIESENHGLHEWDWGNKVTFMESLPNGGTGHWVIGMGQVGFASYLAKPDFSGNTVREKQRTEAVERIKEKKAAAEVSKKEAEERQKQEEIAKKKEAEEERQKQEELAKKEADKHAKQEELAKKKEAEERQKQEELAKKEADKHAKQEELAKKQEAEKLERQKEADKHAKQEELAKKQEAEKLEKQKEAEISVRSKKRKLRMLK